MVYFSPVTLLKAKTDRPPCDPLHDEVFAALQVLDDVFAQSGLGFDEALRDFVEVKGGEVEHVQYPGEAQVCFSEVTATCVVVSSSLTTAPCREENQHKL